MASRHQYVRLVPAFLMHLSQRLESTQYKTFLRFIFALLHREHALKNEKLKERMEAAKEAKFVPRLTADVAGAVQVNPDLSDRWDDDLEAVELVIEAPRKPAALKILENFQRKPSTSELLMRNLRDRARQEIYLQQETKATGASESDQNEDLKRDENEEDLARLYGLQGDSDDYGDDDLEDLQGGSQDEDEAYASDEEKEEEQPHGVVLSEEEQADAVLQVRHVPGRILESDMEDACLARPDSKAPSEHDDEQQAEDEAILNLLSGEFIAASGAKKLSKSAFVADEADEEDELGNIVQGGDDEKIDSHVLVQELRGMLDDRNIVQDDKTKQFFVKQMVQEELEEADEMLDLLQHKKKRRAEEKMLKKLLLARSRSKNKTNNLALTDTGISTVQYKDDDFILDEPAFDFGTFEHTESAAIAFEFESKQALKSKHSTDNAFALAFQFANCGPAAKPTPAMPRQPVSIISYF
jgi:hypothetical protein